MKIVKTTKVAKIIKIVQFCSPIGEKLTRKFKGLRRALHKTTGLSRCENTFYKLHLWQLYMYMSMKNYFLPLMESE